MITKKKGINYDGRTSEFYGLSTDTKPTDESVVNGSTFLEMDTGKYYMYDGASSIWLELCDVSSVVRSSWNNGTVTILGN